MSVANSVAKSAVRLAAEQHLTKAAAGAVIQKEQPDVAMAFNSLSDAYYLWLRRQDSSGKAERF